MAQDSNTFVPVSFFRLTNQNDLYQLYLQSDKHFTNGAHIQASHGKFAQPVFKKVLIGNFFEGYDNFIISVGQDMHTPEDFNLTEVDSTDRPYAGLLYATFNRTISSPEKLRILRSSLYLGVIGPASGAGKTQNFLHRILGNDLFQGWDNQIGNGLVLDYAVMYRKGIGGLPKFMDLSWSMNTNIGTILNFASVSSRMILGKFNNPYYNLGLYTKRDPEYNKEDEKFPNFQAYAFFEGFGGAMLYNGTASGSLISFEKSPYVIPPGDIYRWIYGGSYGITLSYKHIFINYRHFVLNQQYGSKKWHGWGELNLLFSF
jgi:hypothetical protein